MTVMNNKGVFQELWNNFHFLTKEQIQEHHLVPLSEGEPSLLSMVIEELLWDCFRFAVRSRFRNKLLSSWLLQGRGLLHSTLFLGKFSSSELFSWSKLSSETECSEDIYSTLKQSLNLLFSSVGMDIDCRSAFCLFSRFCNEQKLFMSETIKRHLQQFQKNWAGRNFKKLPRK